MQQQQPIHPQAMQHPQAMAHQAMPQQHPMPGPMQSMLAHHHHSMAMQPMQTMQPAPMHYSPISKPRPTPTQTEPPPQPRPQVLDVSTMDRAALEAELASLEQAALRCRARAVELRDAKQFDQALVAMKELKSAEGKIAAVKSRISSLS